MSWCRVSWSMVNNGIATPPSHLIPSLVFAYICCVQQNTGRTEGTNSVTNSNTAGTSSTDSPAGPEKIRREDEGNVSNMTMEKARTSHRERTLLEVSMYMILCQRCFFGVGFIFGKALPPRAVLRSLRWLIPLLLGNTSCTENGVCRRLSKAGANTLTQCRKGQVDVRLVCSSPHLHFCVCLPSVAHLTVGIFWLLCWWEVPCGVRR